MFACWGNVGEMPSDPAFRPTRWSLIVALRGGTEPERRKALDELCTAYWYPLYAYARRRGCSPEDAADVTQSFFGHLLDKEIFNRADPDRGKLRTFLLTLMQRFLRDDWRKQQRLKRGGGVPLLSIDEPLAEGRYAHEPVDHLTPEALYHRRWALTLLERTLDGLQRQYETQGKAALFAALKPYLENEQPVAEEVGARLKMEAGTVRVAASRLRRRYREQLLQEVAAGLDEDSEAAINAEVDELFRALG